MATFKDTSINSTDAIRLPVGTTAERPTSPQLGMLRYNTTETYVEIYNGEEWVELAGGGAGGLYEFEAVTLTPNGITGRNGPPLADLRSGATVTGDSSWLNDTNFFNASNGIITWTVPATATYTFQLHGANGFGAPANGHRGGYGARFTTNNVSLTEGQLLRMTIGQPGQNANSNNGGGGGGGTSIFNNSSGQLIAVAGGGGGAGSSQAGRDAQNTTSGGGGIHGSPGAIINNGGSGGSGGNTNTGSASGTCSWSGAGWSGDGPGTSQCGRGGGSAATRLNSTAIGGVGQDGAALGGFGGGGGGANNNGYGGGAGGYSGGGAGGFPGGGGGGFGGSFSNHGINSFSATAGQGFITITKTS